MFCELIAENMHAHSLVSGDISEHAHVMHAN
jgi:hypothetical protein